MLEGNTHIDDWRNTSKRDIDDGRDIEVKRPATTEPRNIRRKQNTPGSSSDSGDDDQGDGFGI